VFECGGGGELKRADWLRKMCLGVDYSLELNVGSYFWVQDQHDVRSVQTYERVIWGSSMVRSPNRLLNCELWGIGLTELCVQEDPMATLQIPESATTQAATGCR
jgi:hypothetical protein